MTSMATLCHGYDCKKPGIYTCGRCKLARYCSKECQVSNWKYHKITCTKVDTGICVIYKSSQRIGRDHPFFGHVKLGDILVASVPEINQL